MSIKQPRSFKDITNEIVKDNLYWQWDVIARAIAEVLVCEDVPEGTPAGKLAKMLKSAAKTSVTKELAVSDISDLSVTAQQINSVVSSGVSGSVPSSPSSGESVSIKKDSGYNSEWELKITGSGTAASPYLIYTPRDFCSIGRYAGYQRDKCYKLMNNLDFAPVIGMTADENGNITVTDSDAPFYNGGKGYIPVCYTNADDTTTSVFNGSFDGNGKTIKGIVSCGFGKSGLFGEAYNTFSCNDLTIKDSCFVSGHDNSYFFGGAIAGQLGGIISGITSYAVIVNNVDANNVRIGGLAGYMSSPCTVTRCAIYGKIINKSLKPEIYVGGLFGTSSTSNPVIKDCIVTCNMSGGYVCGIMYHRGTGTFENLVYAGIGRPSVSSSEVYGIIPSNRSLNCYYNSVSQVTESGEGYGIPVTADRMREESFIGLINADPSEPSFRFNENGIADGFPLTFEAFCTAEDIADLPVALLDVEGRTVQSSRYAFSKLLSLTTKEAVRESLAGLPSIKMIELAPDGWELLDTGYYDQTVEVEGLTMDCFIFTAQSMQGTEFGNVHLAVTSDNRLSFKIAEGDVQGSLPVKFPVIIVRP